MEKETQTKVIVDLLKMKSHLIPQYPLADRNVINPNITYCILETIIASLMDKYGIKDRDIREILIKDYINNKESN